MSATVKGTPASEPRPAGGAVVLVATFHTTPERRGELRRRLLEMVELTRAEPGCLRYDLHDDVDDGQRFVFVETWADEAALNMHMTTSHVGALLQDVPQLTTRDIDLVRLRAI